MVRSVSVGPEPWNLSRSQKRGHSVKIVVAKNPVNIYTRTFQGLVADKQMVGPI